MRLWLKGKTSNDDFRSKSNLNVVIGVGFASGRDNESEPCCPGMD